MPVTVTMTLSDADAARVQAAIAGTPAFAGMTAKQALVDLLVSLVRGYEHGVNDVNFSNAYTPIGPT